MAKKKAGRPKKEKTLVYGIRYKATVIKALIKRFPNLQAKMQQELQRIHDTDND